MKLHGKDMGNSPKSMILDQIKPKKGERNVADMIKELFKKKYKQEMEIHKTMESKIDLKKETSSGILNFNGTFKPKDEANIQRREQQTKNQEELNDY